MAWYNGLLNLFRAPRVASPTPPAAVTPVARAPRLPGGRASVDTSGSFPTSTWLVMPPPNHEQNWWLMTADAKSMERISPLQLMEVMADLDPTFGAAHFQFLLYCNSGYEIHAYPINSDNVDEEDARGKAAIDDFIKIMADQGASGRTFQVILDRLFTNAYFRGAPCAELVLDERGRIPLLIAVPDAASIRWQKVLDPVLGEIWRPGQWQYGRDFVALDRPTFFISPIHPMPGSPYGRPLASPALFSAMTITGILHDLKRVIQHQGYERLDISVNMTKILENAPHLAADPEAFQRMEQALVAEVQAAFNQLEPDDTYIHTDTVEMNKPVGVSQSSLSGIDGVLDMLQRLETRGLKSMPSNMGLEAREGDLQANRSTELFFAGIRSIQHTVEEMMEGIFTLALQVQGIQSRVEFRFSELRASEDLRNLQAEQLSILNEAAKRNEGWQSQDEASEAVTGSPAVAPAPVLKPPGQANAPGIGNLDGQPSVNTNAALITEVRAARAEVENVLERIRENGYH